MENVHGVQCDTSHVTFLFVAKAGICQLRGHNNVESCCNICDKLR